MTQQESTINKLNYVKHFTELINSNKPFLYAKFGDGEYLCASGKKGKNSSGTVYTDNIRNLLIDSIQYYSKQDNIYLGKWHINEYIEFWDKLCDIKPKYIWSDYLSFIIFNKNHFINEKYNLYKSIKNSKRQKIFICNKYNANDKSKKLFNINNIITIHPTDWVELEYNNILNTAINSVIDENNVMFLTSAGLGAKPLLANLHQKFPNGIFIDIGSALDMICGDKITRDYHVTYKKDEIYNFLNDLLE